MSKKDPNGFMYHFCAITGWFLILIGLGAASIMALTGGDTRGRLIVAGSGLVVLLAGVAIVRIVDKNIFRALDRVFHLM